jgi:hypothetical protein
MKRLDWRMYTQMERVRYARDNVPIFSVSQGGVYKLASQAGGGKEAGHGMHGIPSRSFF